MFLFCSICIGARINCTITFRILPRLFRLLTFCTQIHAYKLNRRSNILRLFSYICIYNVHGKQRASISSREHSWCFSCCCYCCLTCKEHTQQHHTVSSYQETQDATATLNKNNFDLPLHPILTPTLGFFAQCQPTHRTTQQQQQKEPLDITWIKGEQNRITMMRFTKVDTRKGRRNKTSMIYAFSSIFIGFATMNSSFL